MALERLLTLIKREGIEPDAALLARWTDGAEGFDPAPSYGAFVDHRGLVVTGARPRVHLEGGNPRDFVVDDSLEAALPPGTKVVFLDWGSQSLPWSEVFDLWRFWESEGRVVDCGAVAVPWTWADRWVAPGWVAFRGGFDGAPLETVSREVLAFEPEAAAHAHDGSLLARARRWKEDQGLPQVPFTLESLADPTYPWPQGA